MTEPVLKALADAEDALRPAGLKHAEAYDQSWQWLRRDEHGTNQRLDVENTARAINDCLEKLSLLREEELQSLRFFEAKKKMELFQAILTSVLQMHNAGKALEISEKQTKNETPFSIQKSLEAMQHQLELLSNPVTRKKPSALRRLVMALGLAAGIAAGGMTTQAKNTAPPITAQQGQLRPGFYLQFSATKNLPNQEWMEREYNIKLALHKTQTEVPFKLLAPQRYDNKEQAIKGIRTLQQIPETLGVIQLLQNGDTLWVKTVEDEILEKADKPCQSRDYDKYVHEAVEWYWPKDRRTYQMGNKTYNIEQLILAVIDIESAGGILLDSDAGAQGPMQMMPAMFEEFFKRTKLKETGNIKIFRHNIHAGVQHLLYLFDNFYPQYSVKQILQMYNYGESRVKKAARLPEAQRDKALPKETREYFGRFDNAYQRQRTTHK